MTASTEVDAYIAAAPPLRRERLDTLRALVHRAVPHAVESLDWRIPVFRVGERYVAMASQKNYLSVYLGHNEGLAAIIAAVPGLKCGKGCLNVTDRTPLPLDLLEPVIRQRLAAGE